VESCGLGIVEEVGDGGVAVGVDPDMRRAPCEILDLFDGDPFVLSSKQFADAGVRGVVVAGVGVEDFVPTPNQVGFGGCLGLGAGFFVACPLGRVRELGRIAERGATRGSSEVGMLLAVNEVPGDPHIDG
jgi:hypothetical protein